MQENSCPLIQKYPLRALVTPTVSWLQQLHIIHIICHYWDKSTLQHGKTVPVKEMNFFTLYWMLAFIWGKEDKRENSWYSLVNII